VTRYVFTVKDFHLLLLAGFSGALMGLRFNLSTRFDVATAVFRIKLSGLTLENVHLGYC
jgi:hypothetical protein